MSNRVLVGGKRAAVILDIDGFLADNVKRLAVLDRAAPDWRAFHEACEDDPVLPGGAALASVLFDTGYIVALVTCRWEEYRSATQRWLVRNRIRSHLLLMREPGMEHYEVKEVHATWLQQRYHVALAVDDDPAHGEQYSALGIPFLYVHSGYYEAGYVPDNHLST